MKIFRLFLTASMSGCVILVGCGANATTPEETPATEKTSEIQETTVENSTVEESTVENNTVESAKGLQMKIGEEYVSVDWEDNEAVSSLRKMTENSGLEIETSNYGSFEQVGEIGTSLPGNDIQLTTSPGDIVLYSGDKIVIFYGSNSWSYTKLGKITDKSEKEIKELLDKEKTTVTLEMR